MYGLVLALGATTFLTKAVAEEFLIGTPFHKVLDQSTGLTWSGDSLRNALQELSRSKKVAILLDRRIDPTQELKLSRANIPLRDLIVAIADFVGAGSTVVGNVVYVGPKPSAERLTLLIKLRGQELAQLAATKSAPMAKEAKEPKNLWQTRAAKFKDQRTLSWVDFDHPRELLQQLETRYQFEIEQLDKIPHDLWAGNSLPQVTAAEALSLLLIQFGSTFQFLPDRAAIRIVPLREEEAVVERSYSTPASQSEKVIRELRDKFPKAKIEQKEMKVTIRATAEQHLLIAQIMKQSATGNTVRSPVKKSGSKSDKPEPSPLSRKHTLTVKNASLLEVIKTFEGAGVRFDYDREQLEVAKISLDRKVDIDVKGMTADAIFSQLLEPLGLEVSAEGETLRLSPKQK
ncbi:MAG: STN domain-containing protein [Planctomycetia bacterium]|nr:STN domain-containing protein [Planctomycetia bacterium]